MRAGVSWSDRRAPLRPSIAGITETGWTRSDVSSVDSKSWVQDAQNGDVAAFERLYEAYVNRTYALCLRMTGNPSDAEDCTQNAFISAWRKLDQFRASSDFGTWLHRIAVNEVLMAQRRRGGSEDELDDAHAASEQHPGAGLDLEAAIASLPARARHVFVLRAIYGYSHEEVAATLEIAPGTARAHYFRARDALKRALDSENDDD